MQRLIFLLLLSLCCCSPALAQNSAYEAYIQKDRHMAIDQMRRYKIPASITLAQGLLESNAGRSVLATEANNHFGIKVGGSWNGPYLVRSDDRPDDRFRKYRSAAESYEDHSLFLLRPRYSALFRLPITDYVGWAHGLKAAGYATNPAYPQLLINIIHNYQLAQYDAKAYEPTAKKYRKQQMLERARLCNDVVYIVAQGGETFATMAKSLGIRERHLRRNNEVDGDYVLRAGQRVFLGKKKTHAERSLRRSYYTVRPGDSMHGIAQQLGIRMACLYKWNKLPNDYRPSEGDRLKLK